MKMLIVSVLCAAVVSAAYAEESVAPAAATAPKVACKDGKCKLSPEAKKAQKEAKQAERDAKDAALAGLSVEEWKKLTPAQKKDRMMFARDKKLAEKKGISVDELRKQREEATAKRLGVPFEEWSKLDENGKKAKKKEFYQKKAEEAKAKKGEKALAN